MIKNGETVYDGSSCISGPGGKWLVEPVVGSEEIVTAELESMRCCVSDKEWIAVGTA